MNPFKSKMFIVAFCMVVFFFFVWFSDNNKKVVPKVKWSPTIERVVRNGMYSVDDNPKLAVDYIDRRNSEVTIYYNDENSDGYLDEVSYSSDGKNKITFVLTKNESMAEKVNFKRFSNGLQYIKVLEAPKVSFWSKSPEGQELEMNYQNVIIEYKNLNPHANIPEGQIQKEVVRPKVVKIFEMWAKEYIARRNDPRQEKNGRVGEIASYREYLAEKYMKLAWDRLNDREKDAIFEWDWELPNACKIGVILFGNNVFTRNPRREFEEDMNAPQETDYMSAWSIFQEFDQQKNKYEAELKYRGFTF